LGEPASAPATIGLPELTIFPQFLSPVPIHSDSSQPEFTTGPYRVQQVQGENGDHATEEAAEKMENLSLSCDPAADSQVDQI